MTWIVAYIVAALVFGVLDALWLGWAGNNFYRPRLAATKAKYEDKFPKIELFTIDEAFGGWRSAQKTHFDDGGVFDQIYTPGK